MTEHGFVASIHRRLALVSKEVYALKINMRFSNGIPDAWYSGPSGSVWVEYKYLPRTPKGEFTVPLSPLQLRWLVDRQAEGRKVAVIVGCPKGAAIFTAPECLNKVQATDWLSTIGVVLWITKMTAEASPK